MNRVNIKPEIIKWARERSGRDIEGLLKNSPKLEDWESGLSSPTLKQLEKFAKATRTPLGYFFLPEPPEEKIPIADLRSISGTSGGAPSPDLLDTIHAMQQRQAWLSDERKECEAEPLDFLGSARLTDDPEAVGREMRRIIGFGEGWASEVPTWKEAVSELRRGIERLGVMAIINGVVGNNARRKLDVREFRGFALYDAYAPLIFVNGADAKSAQMFTLAHELAHVWLGPKGEGLSGFEGIFPGGEEVEIFCDKAAAEFLLPERELKEQWPKVKEEPQPFKALAGKFKISPIVAGRRAMDLRLVDRDLFFKFYYEYISQERKRPDSGGDFYNNQNTRVGKLFASYVIRAAKEGRLSFREAYSLTGLNGGAFQEYAFRLGFDLP